MYIDKDQQAYLKMLEGLAVQYGSPFATDEMSVDASRAIVHDMQRGIAAGGAKIPSIQTFDPAQTGLKIDIRIYRDVSAIGSQSPVLVYVHGGGFCINSIDTHDCLHREYAKRLGWTVVAPNYRKAPEYPFPTAIEDISSVTNWLILNAEKLNIDANNLFIGGDSAGGNLALTVPLSMRCNASQPFSGCIVNYGVLDTNFDTPSYSRFGDGPYLLSTADMKRFFNWYAPNEGQRSDPLISPLGADFSALPPVHICTGEIDVLASENIELHQKLGEQGVSSELHVFSGLMHGFVRIPHIIQAGDEALNRQVSWLQAQRAHASQA